MLISLIIPVYKVEKYIKDCLQSVMSQSFDQFECILVDDKTPDKSAELAVSMIEAYQGNIVFRILHHDKNMGLPNARNTGIMNATGDYLLFLDSDDTLTEDCMETMVSLMEQHPGVDLIQCDIYDEKRRIYDITKLPVFCEGSHRVFSELLLLHLPWMVVGKLVRKQFLFDNGLLFDKEILIHEDLNWSYFVCMKAESLVSSQKVVYIYNTANSESIMQQSDRCFERSAHYYIIILDRLLSNVNEDLLPDNRLFLENLFFYVGTTIEKSLDITTETKFAFKKLRNRFIKGAWHNCNIPEVLYLTHLYAPFKKLIHIKWYRRNMYLYEKVIRWSYGRR